MKREDRLDHTGEGCAGTKRRGGVSAAVTCWLRPVRVVCQEFVCDVSSDFPPGVVMGGVPGDKGREGGGWAFKIETRVAEGRI